MSKHVIARFWKFQGTGLPKFTLWLCQNSYWKWPLVVDLAIENGDFNSYVKLPEGTGESPWISYWKCHVLQLYRLFLYKKLDRPWTDHGQITTFHETKIPMVKSPWNLDFGWYSKSCSFMISYHFFSIFWYIRNHHHIFPHVLWYVYWWSNQITHGNPHAFGFGCSVGPQWRDV